MAELFSVISEAQIIEKAKQAEEIKNLILMSYQGNREQFFVSLKIPKDKLPTSEEIKKWTQLYWKSHLDLFTPFVNANAEEKVFN